MKGLADTMMKWSGAGALSDADFAAAFFDRDGGDPAVKLLRQAGETAAAARSHDDLRNASTLLAKAGQQVGLDRWPGFVSAAIELAAPIADFIQVESRTANDAAGGNGRVMQAEFPANDRSDLMDRKAARGSDTKNPGGEIRLPNGQTNKQV